MEDDRFVLCDLVYDLHGAAIGAAVVRECMSSCVRAMFMSFRGSCSKLPRVECFPLSRGQRISISSKVWSIDSRKT